MRFHPVLAVVDTDHDGEISAGEIANSPRSLRGLDVNGDDVLTPVELMPHQAQAQATSIFEQLDLDHDGLVSAFEWGREESSALREVLMSGDRNHDGFATMAELTEELLIREGVSQEPQAAPPRPAGKPVEASNE
jgi:Ca2+-binding EF-hand superfamily protein